MCDTCRYFTSAAVSSVGYEQARNELRTSCAEALGHGITISDLARATGRDEQFITHLIEETSL